MSHWKQISDKILNDSSLNQWLKNNRNKRVVFTNGCFDLLHMGHVKYLSQAADLGETLIIGVNTDDSVRKLKGKHRPIKSEQQRATILASLSFVSAVVLFLEETPLQLIQKIKPQVLVKGGDYTIENIVGASDVISWNGEVKIIPFLAGYSTTAIENKIKLNTEG